MEEKIHDPKLLTGLHLEDETVESLRRHPSIEGKLLKKITHKKIIPNSPMVPNMIFVVLIHTH